MAYEVMSVIYRSADKFKDYHLSGRAIQRETMSSIEGLTESDFHSGAVKFYKEKQMKIGSK